MDEYLKTVNLAAQLDQICIEFPEMGRDTIAALFEHSHFDFKQTQLLLSELSLSFQSSYAFASPPQQQSSQLPLKKPESSVKLPSISFYLAHQEGQAPLVEIIVQSIQEIKEMKVVDTFAYFRQLGVDSNDIVLSLESGEDSELELFKQPFRNYPSIPLPSPIVRLRGKLIGDIKAAHELDQRGELRPQLDLPNNFTLFSNDVSDYNDRISTFLSERFSNYPTSFSSSRTTQTQQQQQQQQQDLSCAARFCPTSSLQKDREIMMEDQLFVDLPSIPERYSHEEKKYLIFSAATTPSPLTDLLLSEPTCNLEEKEELHPLSLNSLPTACDLPLTTPTPPTPPKLCKEEVAEFEEFQVIDLDIQNHKKLSDIISSCTTSPITSFFSLLSPIYPTADQVISKISPDTTLELEIYHRNEFRDGKQKVLVFTDHFMRNSLSDSHPSSSSSSSSSSKNKHITPFSEIKSICLRGPLEAVFLYSSVGVAEDHFYVSPSSPVEKLIFDCFIKLVSQRSHCLSISAH